MKNNGNQIPIDYQASTAEQIDVRHAPVAEDEPGRVRRTLTAAAAAGAVLVSGGATVAVVNEAFERNDRKYEIQLENQQQEREELRHERNQNGTIADYEPPAGE